MKEKIKKLTNAAYKILDFLPESDPLKNKAKEKVLAILERLTKISGSGDWVSLKDYFSENKEESNLKLVEEIDLLLGYLELARSQGWISGVNFFIISNEYERIKKEINFRPLMPKNTEQKLDPKAASKTEKEPVSPLIFTSRQSRIIDFLGKNGEAQVMDLQRVLPDVTKRTIRRDLDDLLRAGRIIRQGEFNQVVYKLNEA
jgi:hypothetical protein